jgi:signal transduction histidine kinase
VPRHELVVDAAVPVLVAGVIVAGMALHGGGSAQPLPIALGLAAAASLFARRPAPAWTLAVSGALVLVLTHVDHAAGTLAVVAPAVALYSLAMTRGRAVQFAGGVAAVVAVVGADTLHSGRPGIAQTLGHVMLVAVPLLAAEAIRTHRANLTLLVERRAEQERMQIARELHDVVAHTLTTINVQAGAAAERLGPGEARAALETIEDASRDAIGELRTILGVLRDPNRADAPRAPTPDITNVDELVQTARDGGVDVRLTTTGVRPPRLPDGVSLAAYRIVQESLTNARRHAPGAPVSVELRFEPAALSVSVENGPGGRPSTNGAASGVGIAGMRERAAAIGGTLSAGAVRDGFCVQAELPYELSGR